jgi:hypothetical protein
VTGAEKRAFRRLRGAERAFRRLRGVEPAELARYRETTYRAPLDTRILLCADARGRLVREG